MRYALLFMLVLMCAWLHAEVVVYPPPEGYMSSKQYRITILQDGKAYESFVYVSEAQFSKVNRSSTTQFTNFSFSGTVTVRIEKLNGPFTRVDILPSSNKITAQQQGGSVTFELSRPENLAVEFDKSIEHPLLIFANSLEKNVPRSTDKNVLYFGPGVHQPADTIFLKANQTLYLAGGAVLRSHVYGVNANGAVIRGRGIIEGRRFGHTHGRLISFDNSSHDVQLEGFIVLDAPGYYITSAGHRTHALNVKGMGWWFNTDGFSFGNDGITENCFLKCNDDAIKLYNSGNKVLRTTIWQMENGAPFQISWNSNGDRSGFLVKDCDVIHVDHAWDNPNEGVFDAIHGGSGHLSNFVFEDIRIENISWRLFNIQLLPNKWAKAKHPGSISNLLFKNIAVTSTDSGPLKRLSVIQGFDEASKVRNVVIENLTVNGEVVSDPLVDRFEINTATTENILFRPYEKKQPIVNTHRVEPLPIPWSNEETNGLSSHGMEDYFVWRQGSDFCLLGTETIKGEWPKRGVILYKSADGKNWREEKYLLNRMEYDSTAWFRDDWQSPKLYYIHNSYVLVFASRNLLVKPKNPLGIGIAVADDLYSEFKVVTIHAPVVSGAQPALRQDATGATYLEFQNNEKKFEVKVDIIVGKTTGEPFEIVAQ